MKKAIFFFWSTLLLSINSFGQETGLSIQTFNRKDTAYIHQLIIKADAQLEDEASVNLTDSAFQWYTLAAKYSAELGYSYGAVYSFARLSSFQYNIKRNYRAGLQAAEAAVPFLERLKGKSRFLIPQLLNLKGINQFGMAMYDSAIHSYKLALSAMERLQMHRPKLKSQILNNIGSVFIELQQTEMGFLYYHKALRVSDIDSLTRASYYGNLAATYANLVGDLDSATYWWSKAIVIYKKQQQFQALQYTYANMSIGWQSLKHGNLNKSARYLDSAIQVNPSEAFNNSLVLKAMATQSYEKGNYADAIKNCYRLIEISQSNGDQKDLAYAYRLLSYTYASLRNPELMKAYQVKYREVNAEISSDNLRRSTNAIEIKYRTAEKERALADKARALAVAKAETYRQRNWLILSGGGFLILGLLSVGFVRNTRHRRRMDTQKITALEQQNRIQALSIRMEAEENERIRISGELHDSLGVLISAAKLNNTLLRKYIPSETPRMHTICSDGATILDTIHQEMRSIAHNLKPEYYLPNKGLGHALNQLVSRLQNDAFQIAISEFGPTYQLHPERGFVVFRILEEIINNSLRHSQGSRLDIQLVYTDTHLNISAEDNGIGFEPASDKAGIGLENINRRVEQLQGHLTLNSQKGQGSAYLVEIPY